MSTLMLVGYVVVGLLVGRKVATLVLTQMEKEFPNLGLDGADYVMAGFIALLCGAIWFVTLPAILVGRWMVKPFRARRAAEVASAEADRSLR